LSCIQELSQIDLDLLKSELFLLRGITNFLLNNKFQSFMSFRHSWEYFRIIQSLSDQVKATFSHESKGRFAFLTGIFNIGLAMIPSYFLKILSLIGITPNKERGI
jgi:hypothetical protein